MWAQETYYDWQALCLFSNAYLCKICLYIKRVVKIMNEHFLIIKYFMQELD